MPAGRRVANQSNSTRADRCCQPPTHVRMKAMLQTVIFQSGRGMQQPDNVSMCCLCLQESHSASWGEAARHDSCGLTSLMGYMGQMDKEAFNSTLQKGMSMSQQVDRFQVRLGASC